MKRNLSNSLLRKAGYTDFEAELLKYVASNDIAAGETFNGVPGHARYGNGSSRVTTYVVRNEPTCIIIQWGKGEERTNVKTIEIDPNAYESMRSARQPQPQPKPTTTTTNDTDALGALSALLKQQKEAGRNEARAEFEACKAELLAQLDEASKRGTGTTINVTVNGATHNHETKKTLDPNFGLILRMVANHENVYLYGPAGSGKNVLCEELAKSLGVEFFYQNTILTKFDLSGYKNAGGEFEITEFYKAWTQGGLFMLDEVDNSQAEALVALNAALANGYYTFPGVGRVEAHKNFYCVAAGNTNGQGATDEYCGRYKMDESSRDRFFFVEIDYNKEIETQIVGEHTDVLEFVYELRKVAKELQLSLICGYRALAKLTKYYDDEDIKGILNGFIFRGMQADDINELKSRLNSDNKYTECIRKEF